MTPEKTLALLDRVTAPDAGRAVESLDLLAHIVSEVADLTGAYEQESEGLPDVLEVDQLGTDEQRADLDERLESLQRIVRRIGEQVDWTAADAVAQVELYVEQIA